MVLSLCAMENLAALDVRIERRRASRCVRSTPSTRARNAWLAVIAGFGVGVCVAFSAPAIRVPPPSTIAEERVIREPSAEVVLSAPSTPAGVLEGAVRDRYTHAVLPSATVCVEDTALAAVTDAAGRFRLANTPAGTHVVHVEVAGYLALSKADVLVLPGRRSAITLELDRASRWPGGEVIVRAPTFARSSDQPASD
jgi:Carboxypeptidase regulatory-like domain